MNQHLIGPRPDSWWTGARPVAGAPGVDAEGRVFSLPGLNTATCSRQEVQDYFANGWLLNEVLFASLQGELAFTQAPYHGLRHPKIFYYGHTACLFVNKLRVAGLLNGPVNAHFESLFEVGVDEMSWDDMSKNEMVWPSVSDVTAYRRQVFDLVSTIIATHPGLSEGHPPILGDDPLWSIIMGCEHERIHLETSSVLIREMPINMLRKPEHWPLDGVSFDNDVDLSLIPVPEGSITLGKSTTDPSYSWDNEYGSRHAHVPAFEISRHMITNGQFAAFVAARGYLTRSYWSDTGWSWRCYRNTKHPTFWVQDGPAGVDNFKLRTLFNIIPMPLDWPVCVNFHEAKAYLAWKAEVDGCEYRLPTEAEHTYLRRQCRASLPEAFHSSETSVLAEATNGLGVTDLNGNLWDWCEDDFHPLEGFKINRLYDDFSTPCFDGEHKMILGGSFISTGNEASQTARFHFRPHFHQHAGFHMVRGQAGNPSGAVLLREQKSKYDQKAVLDQYLLFHYGSTADGAHPLAGEQIAHFPQRCAQALVEIAKQKGCNVEKAIDIGCAVGGATFELAKAFKTTIGVDISEPFIHAAQTLLSGADIEYDIVLEGDLKKQARAKSAAAAHRDGLSFRRADACSLPAEYVDFDVVLVANLLCRLPSPQSLLGRMGGLRGLVRPGGIVAFASPYSWLPQFTQKDAWLGGYEENGAMRFSANAMQEALGDEFVLVHREDMPFMIREHARKFEFVVSDFNVWQRKA